MSKKFRAASHKAATKAHDEKVEGKVAEPETQAAAEPVADEQKTDEAQSATATKLGSGKFVGITTGMRVQAFQNKLLAENNERKLTDEQILEELQKEFPNNGSRIFSGSMDLRLSIVHAMRREFNAGVHGGQTEKPKEPILRYNEKGEAVAEPNRRRRNTEGEQPVAQAADSSHAAA